MIYSVYLRGKYYLARRHFTFCWLVLLFFKGFFSLRKKKNNAKEDFKDFFPFQKYEYPNRPK